MPNDAENSDDQDEDRPLSEDELRRRAERLIAEGRMPSLEELLRAMQEVAGAIAQEREMNADDLE